MASHFPADVNQRFFGALQLYPRGKVYEGLEHDEQVVLLIRRHPLSLLGPLLAGVGLSLAPGVVFGVVVFAPVPEVIAPYMFVLGWFLIAFALYYFLSLFMRYMADVWIVTNERIIDIDANTIARKAATEVDLAAVAGASQMRGGGLFFGGVDRGAVLVRIIGEEDDLIPQVPMSGEVARVIGELAEAVQRRRGSAIDIDPGMGIA